MMPDRKILADILDRLTRTESRVVRGFIKLGVDPREMEPDCILDVDDTHRIVYVKSQELSVGQILFALHKQGYADPTAYMIKLTE